MHGQTENEKAPTKYPTTVERTSDREVVVRRTVDAPARIVFQAWTTPELIPRWWVPKSIGATMISCEMDVRTGGGYRFVFRMGESEPMAFFGKYIEVVAPVRLVWTNDEAGDGGAVTTLTLEEKDGKTLMVLHDLHASKEAADAALASGEKDGMGETFEQLDELLVSLGASR